MPQNDYLHILSTLFSQSENNLYLASQAFLSQYETLPEEERKVFFHALLHRFPVVYTDLCAQAARDFQRDIQKLKDPALYEQLRATATQLIQNQLRQSFSGEVSSLPEDAFYEQLRHTMHDTNFVVDTEQQALYLCALLTSPYIPYYDLGPGLLMPQEEFESHLQSLEEALDKARFISNGRYRQKTQRASLLMKLAADLPDDRVRAVFWVVILSRQEFQLRSLQKQLKELREATASSDH